MTETGEMTMLFEPALNQAIGELLRPFISKEHII
jgi:hypothetical protein